MCWWETIWTKDDGETKVVKGCAFSQLPDYFNQMHKAAAGAAVSAQEARNVGEELKAETRQRHRSSMLLLAQIGVLQDVQSPSIRDLDGDGHAELHSGVLPQLPNASEGEQLPRPGNDRR